MLTLFLSGRRIFGRSSFLLQMWLVAVAVALSTPSIEAVPAFPGAEGAGAVSVGGRWGRTIYVTNLQDRGAGSFRAAVEAAGERNVVFAVSGEIELQSPVLIEHPFLTVAGQTAPGDGICISGDTVTINAADVIFRYLRFRRGDLESRDDALNAVNSPGRVIIDHCSFSWGLDENVSLYRYMSYNEAGERIKGPIQDITIQWSISSEALNPFHHAFGATWGGRNASFHHNLFAHNTARNPSVGWGDHFDFRNNVIFNWGHRTMDGGDATSRVNVINNYFKPGPATNDKVRRRIARPEAFRIFQDGEQPGQTGFWHIAGNHVEGYPEITADNWAGGVDLPDPAEEPTVEAFIERSRSDGPAPAAAVRTTSALEAYEAVLAGAGATLPRRDPVDLRIVSEVRSGEPTYGDGIVNDPAEVGGWPEYRSLPALPDSDFDGMPDAWERRYGLNPELPGDAVADPDEDGYSNLEEFFNGTSPREFIDYTLPENNVNTL